MIKEKKFPTKKNKMIKQKSIYKKFAETMRSFVKNRTKLIFFININIC